MSLAPKKPKDKCCGELMDTWHNSIWCTVYNGVIRAQLYKCFDCGKQQYRQIIIESRWGIPKFSETRPFKVTTAADIK